MNFKDSKYKMNTITNNNIILQSLLHTEASVAEMFQHHINNEKRLCLVRQTQLTNITEASVLYTGKPGVQ